MKQIKWFERKFNFENNQNIFPSIIERLSGTSLRLEDKLKTINSHLLTDKKENKWSIQENIGHLIDLETLWQGRFEDILNNEVELRPTDLANSKTDLANHNATKIEDLVATFRKLRQHTIYLLENIDEEMVFKSALHPTLKTPMRTMDLFLFVAEHDDHHLAKISEIIKHNSVQQQS
ncbi:MULTISPECIES: DinB family protein [unclassified Flavobacterium]|uniref:DinB family protein n=1 Tax=unclassified Flavobacterium TaxID=196869 RepID=UPI003F8ECC39